MIREFLRVLGIFSAAAAISGIAYYALCLWTAFRFLRHAGAAQLPEHSPPVSILKPLKGTDPGMYECFRSHCLQNYSDFEIIFGVSDQEDPAIESVERLRAEFPQHNIRLIHCAQNLGSNTKVSNLVQMLPHSRHEHLIVNDSDIRVPPDYLRRVLAPLSDPNIGLVTCPYRGVASSTLGSKLESLGISTDFIPGVLVARNIEGIKFGLGSTLAFRRSDLSAIGGFEALVDFLADDYQLGNRLTALGKTVELSDIVVESFLPPYTMRGFFDHQIRWARTVKDARFWGYVGTGITFGLPWALLAVAFSAGALWAWILLAVTIATRFAMAAYSRGEVLHDPQPGLLWLLPLRDLLGFLLWIASFFGRTVTWRGGSYTLRDGRLARISS